MGPSAGVMVHARGVRAGAAPVPARSIRIAMRGYRRLGSAVHSSSQVLQRSRRTPAGPLADSRSSLRQDGHAVCGLGSTFRRPLREAARRSNVPRRSCFCRTPMDAMTDCTRRSGSNVRRISELRGSIGRSSGRRQTLVRCAGYSLASLRLVPQRGPYRGGVCESVNATAAKQRTRNEGVHGCGKCALAQRAGEWIRGTEPGRLRPRDPCYPPMEPGLRMKLFSASVARYC